MIRLKLILRNIFQKPLRSAAVIISLAAATFAALFCISGICTAKNQLYSFFTATMGDTKIIVNSPNLEPLDISDDEILDSCNYVTIAYAGTTFTLRNDEYYNYVNQIKANVMGIDADKFYEFNMLEEPCDITDGVTITKALALKLKKEEGDEIILNGQDSKEYKVKINKVLDNKKFLSSNTYCVLTTYELANKIACRDGGFTMMFIDTADNNTDEVAAVLQENHPTYLINGLVGANTEDSVGSMTSIYYLVFALVVLMVGFIVVSMSKHIINERMSVIGMLRSIGGSIKNTSLILFAESAVYGLFGGIIGSVLYLLFKDSFVLGMFVPAGAENLEISDGINFFSVTLVILAVMAMQCGFSAAAILKASKTPIRDIIFGTKDTAYKPSKTKFIIGGAMLAVGVLLFLIFDDFVSSVLAVFLSVIGAVMIYPFVTVLASKLAMNLFERTSKPVAKLAAREAGSKKSSVYSGQLIFSAISLTMAVVMLSVSVMYVFSYTNDCDILMSNISKTTENYGYISEIDGVTDVKYNYYTTMDYDTNSYINGIETSLIVLSDINKEIEEAPDSVGENEIVFDKSLARRLGVKIGDTVELKLKSETYLPKTINLKVTALCNTIWFDMSCKTVIINHNTYLSVYSDIPTSIEINTETGKKNDVMKMLNLTNSESETTIYTSEELEMMNTESTSGIMSILYVLIILGLLLSVLGTANNMIIGFEQSRRKYAVLYSVAMSREKLKKLILIETIFLSSVSIIIASVVGVYFLNVINKALGSLEMNVPLIVNPLYIIAFAIIIFLLITATSVKPMRSLSKMMISEEIKISTD